MSPVPDTAKIRCAGQESWDRDQPAPSRPVLGQRCAHLPSPEGPALPAVGGPRAGSGRQDTGLSSGLARNSKFLLSLPVRGRRGLGGPRVSRVQGHIPLPPMPAPPRGSNHRSTHRLPPPGFLSRTSAALASRLARPPASLSSPLRSAGAPGGASAESGVGGQAGARARAAEPPREGEGGRPLSSRGRVNALHLEPACGWGSFPRALGPGRPPPQALSAGRVGPPRFPVPAQAAAGAGGGVGAGAGGGVSGPAGPSLVNILFC